MDIPDPCEYVISKNETFNILNNMKDEELADNLFIYALLPYCEGEIFKKTGAIMKGWKKMYFSIRVDRLEFFKDQKDHIEDWPIFTISVKDIKRVDKLGPKKKWIINMYKMHRK